MEISSQCSICFGIGYWLGKLLCVSFDDAHP
jgi:hypothetical protein